jgi:cell wall-associated NlpC family hydrolase
MILSILLTGCATSLPTAPPSGKTSNLPPLTSTPQRSPVLDTLYLQYQQWKGTPYRFGGLDKRGVDCSGLVYHIFKNQFGLTLPRTTAEQVRQGIVVSKNNLQPGDLVFFKTGRHSRHVGIYLENGMFLHVSSGIKKRVTLSKIDNIYWKRKYWTARRILQHSSLRPPQSGRRSLTISTAQTTATP